MFSLWEVLLINYLLGVFIISVLSLVADNKAEKAHLFVLIVLWPIGMILLMLSSFMGGSDGKEKESSSD